MIKCSFCGNEFDEHESKSACGGCPMAKVCNKNKCPNCGYEIPKEPTLVKLIKNWGQKNDK